MASNCLICKNSSRELDSAIWNHARRQNDPTSAAKVASEMIESDVDEKMIRQHLARHQPWQPPPIGYINRQRSLESTKKLSPKLLMALKIIWRHGVATEWQLREILWPTSQYANENTAKASCYRDLAKLVNGDWLYRAWPPRSHSRKIAGQRRKEAVLMLGRESIAWIEREHGVKPPIVVDSIKVDWDDVTRKLKGMDLLAGFASSANHGATVSGTELKVSMDLNNCFGFDDSQLWFRAAGLQSFDRRVRPAGLAMAKVGTQDNELILPFFYVIDPMHELPTRAAKRHLAWFGAQRTMASRARFPALGENMPPVLIITSDAHRSAELAQEMSRQSRSLRTFEPPALLMSDMESIMNSWEAPVWKLAWDAKDQSKARSLIEILLNGNKKRLQEDPITPGIAVIPRRLMASRKNPVSDQGESN